jgi:hypothetical protein
VFWSPKYFFRILILNYGSGTGRPINYGSDRVRILPVLFAATEKKISWQIGKQNEKDNCLYLLGAHLPGGNLEEEAASVQVMGAVP